MSKIVNFSELDDDAAGHLHELLEFARENGGEIDPGDLLSMCVRLYHSVLIGDLVMTATPQMDAKCAAHDKAALEAARVAGAVQMALPDPVRH